MNDRQANKADMLVRVDNLCAVERPADFPTGTRAGELAQIISDTVKDLQAQAGAQAGARRLAQASTDAKEAARNALRATLEEINRTARGMDADMPGTAAMFRLPPRKDEALLSAARAFHQNATPLAAEFIKHELPADFLARLQQQITDFEHARAEQATHADAQVAATTAVRTLLAAGTRAVRQLDPIVRNKYRNDPAALAAWESASHIESAPKRKAAAAKPATPKTD